MKKMYFKLRLEFGKDNENYLIIAKIIQVSKVS
jgi:hypothetical protein